MLDPEQLLSSYQARLTAYLLHLVRNTHDAEELFQEVAALVLMNPQILTRAGDVFAYLRGVARHLAAARHAERMRYNEVLRRWTEWAWEADPGDELSEDNSGRQLTALRHCREQLPARIRNILDLHYDEGHELKTIGAKIGLQVGAVKVALFRARQSLADCIRRKVAQEAQS